MQTKIKISSISLGLQYLGFFSHLSSLLFDVNQRGEAKDINNVKSSSLYLQTNHLVIYGDIAKYQNKILDLVSWSKTADIIFHISNPVTYPIFNDMRIFPIVVIDPNINSIIDSQYLKQLSQCTNISFVIKMKSEYYTFKNTLDFVRDLVYNNSYIDLNRVFLAPDISIKLIDSKTYDMMVRIAMQLKCKIAFSVNPYIQEIA